MDDPRTSAGMEAPEKKAVDLLSVDADAHLLELASSMFPSPAQLPVELVRDALKRGAKAVRVEVQPGRLRMEDDGAGITEGVWRDLSCAFAAGGAAADREKAIGALLRAASPGIGLLAASVPRATRIRIENSTGRGGAALVISGGQVRHAGSRPGACGTRITIDRRRGPADLEKKMLRELCAAVPYPITLNGRRIERRPLLRRSLVRQSVDAGRGQALVSVPAAGDICRVWLLDQWIPWQVITFVPRHALVFEAALESGTAPAEAELERIAHAAAGMYRWLAENHHAFPEKYQERIEELLFKKAGWSGDLNLISAFAPFRLWRSRQRLTLEEVRRKAERNILYALPLGSDPDHVLGRHQEALLLSSLQRDFLINRLKLPLVEPVAPMGIRGKGARLASSALRKIARISARLPRRPLRSLACEQLSGEERSLCREMESSWLRMPRQGPAMPSPRPLRVAMVEGRGLAPAVWRNDPQQNVLHLRRRHTLVRLAVRRVAEDPANADLALAALAPMPLLTAAGY